MTALFCHRFVAVLAAVVALASPTFGLIVTDADHRESVNGQSAVKVASCAPIDLRSVVLVKSPFGVISSGVLLPGGRHVLTAAHVVSESIGEAYATRGVVEIYSGQDCKRFSWGEIIVHPQYQQGGVWDAAVLVLPEKISSEITLYPIAQEAKLHTSVVKCGWGQGGQATSGEAGESGVLRVGLNRYEANVNGALAAHLAIREKSTPLVVLDFDDGTAARDAMGAFSLDHVDHGKGGWEAMPTNGDSGSPTFAWHAQRGWEIVGITVGRKGSRLDMDGRPNSSVGEWAVDLDLVAIRPWLTSILSGRHSQKTKQ